MPVLRPLPFALAALACALAPAAAQEQAPVEPVAPQTTIVYVFPTSPSTFVPVAGLPSFLVMPGAPLPEVATQVVQTVPVPVFPVPQQVAVTDLDCAHFVGTVRIVPPDVHGLDDDGDGLGCEPEERVGTGR